MLILNAKQDFKKKNTATKIMGVKGNFKRVSCDFPFWGAGHKVINGCNK